MIEQAKSAVNSLGWQDKVEFKCGNIFDEDFSLDEKVDAVVICFGLTTFVTSLEQLTTIMKQCKKLIKPDGYLLITDFSYYSTPADMLFGYRTTTVGQEEPKDFDREQFNKLKL